MFQRLTWLATLVLLAPLADSLPSEVQIETLDSGSRIASGEETLHVTSAEVLSARLFEVQDTRVVHWTERTPAGSVRDQYRVALENGSFSRVRPTRYDLHFQARTYDPLVGAPTFEASPLATTGRIYIVQFQTQSLEAYRDELTRLGAVVHQFLPYQSHLVQLEPAMLETVRELPFVRWVGPYHSEYRVEPWILEGLLAENLPVDQPYHVQVFEKGPVQKNVVAARIEALGGTVEANIPDGFLIRARLDATQLRAVAAFDEVIWIDRWSPPENDMNLVRNDGGANYVESVAGFTGQGVRGECFDGNCISNHQDLQSNPVLFHGFHTGTASHGTPVTGICFGDGTGLSSARGLLPDGQPIFADNGQVGNRYNHTAQLLQAPYFAVFQTNSWGSSTTTAYNSASMQMDDILFDIDIVITQSQSNTGTQDSRPQAWAKNIVSVGGIRHFNTLTTADDAWNSAGSIGPAADGRIKPDLCHWYESITTTSDSGGYTSFGGTSAATPITGGYFGLFFQMWHEGIFGNATGATVFDSKPHATTARAFVINTANQYPFNAGNADLSRNKQGWGRASVRNLYDLRDRTFWVDETDVLGNLESIVYPLVVEAGEPAFRATMVYLDRPGTTSAGLHRINDLTLQVTAPDGTQYWGNRGMKGSNWTTSGGNANDKDVVENVYVENPDAGIWMVEVFADEINQDGHVETGAVDADFGLVVTGTVGLDGGCTTPTATCDTSANSAGAGAVLTTFGTTSVSANDLQLSCNGLPANQNGLFFFGPSFQDVPFADGRLCVGGQIIRLPVQTASIFGEMTLDLDLGTLNGAIQTGDTQYFQCWYRDPAGPGGTGSNLSGGIETVWCD